MAMRRALATVALAGALAGALAAAGADPARADALRTWWTVETDHFVVHYYEPLHDVARRVAVVAERAHALLVPELRHVPDEKTQVVLVDDTDGANGFASVLPRNRITLFATAPGGDSVLADHDDWLYGLFVHEYAHVLHLDAIAGLPRWVNRLLGKTWAPNQVQPRWVIEGLATYQESRQSSSGRTRATQFDAYVRAAVLRGEPLDLDAVTAGPYEFPRGNAAYLYGGKFLQYVFDRVGADKLAAMSWAYGGAAIPYGINRQLHAATGLPFTTLWDDWQAWLRDRYALQQQAVRRAGERAGRRLTFDTEGHGAPAYTADGAELVWLAVDGVSPRRLRRMPVGGNVGDAADLLRVERMGGFALLSDGSVVYEQSQPYRRDDEYQDLFLWDRPSGVTTRLTVGMRARDPAVSPDHRQVAFSYNGASRSRLAVMPLAPLEEGGTPTVLWEGERYDQVYTPEWSPDGRRLAFSAWRRGGRRDVLVLELATGAVTEVTRDRALDADPAWSPDGATLFWSSDRTGIANVFAHELATGAQWQVTNVVGGAYEPQVSPDGTRLAYAGFDATGFDLFELALDRTAWAPALPYVDDRPPSTDVRDDSHPVPPPRPYRPLETLAPHAWTAELVASSTTGQAVTVRTGGADIAGQHAWTLGATVDVSDGTVNVGASYGYAGLRLPVRLTAGRSRLVRNGYRIDGVSRPYGEETLSATLSTSLPSRRTGAGSLSLSGDLDADVFRLVDRPDDPPDPNQALPDPPLSDYHQLGLALRASWSDVRSYAETLGSIEGHELAASFRLDHPALGARFRSMALTWTYRWHQRLPWGVSPVLALRYAGGLRRADLDRGSAFSLGGAPEQDVATAMLGQARVASSGFLRGYARRVVAGDQYHLLNLEYRHRLWQPERGLATLPLYLRRLHVAALLDAGTAYDGALDLADARLAVGAAVRLDVMFGYFAPGTLELGYARGLSADGLDETWLLLTSTL